MMKKILAVLLVLSVLLLPACKNKVKNRDYDEAEVLAAASDLIAKSVEINEIFYGTGIPASERANAKTSAGYVEADADYLKEHGFSTVDGLKEKCTAVFSDAQCQVMYNTVLEVIKSDNTVVKTKRYFEADGVFYVLPSAEVMMPDAVEYDLTSLRVDRVEGDYVFVTYDATVTTEAGESQAHHMTARLYEEARGWRLASPTYTKYSVYYQK